VVEVEVLSVGVGTVGNIVKERNRAYIYSYSSDGVCRIGGSHEEFCKDTFLI